MASSMTAVRLAAPRGAQASLRVGARAQKGRAQLAVRCGVQVTTKKEGDGKTFPVKGQKVMVHYTGTLADGSKFDSSRDRNQPFIFTIGVGQVIKGWDEGVMQMSVGQQADLVCTPDYGYGERGFPGAIPPNATLTFDVELLSVN